MIASIDFVSADKKHLGQEKALVNKIQKYSYLNTSTIVKEQIDLSKLMSNHTKQLNMARKIDINRKSERLIKGKTLRDLH